MDLDALWDYNNPAASEARFRAQLPAATADSANAQALLLTQLARAVGLQRRFDEARALLDEAVLLLPEAGAVAVIRYQLESGRVHNSAGDSAAAIPHFKRAWKAARAAAEDGYAVDAAHMLAIAAETGEETLAWNERALELGGSFRRRAGTALAGIAAEQPGLGAA